ncbi:MAG TPA: YceI family protein, partial [Actinomycetota bacterium]|nr:YceI family protein [Actinomycetota bacterium]
PNRDAHVRSADFLDVENHPTITFSASGPIRRRGTEFMLTGDLTVRGTTKPVTLDAEYLGVVTHPQMGTRMGLSATGEINKDDFGVSFNAALETGGFVLGKTIRLEIEVEAVLKS